jgi:quinoprotein glucose dehydrogenase
MGTIVTSGLARLNTGVGLLICLFSIPLTAGGLWLVIAGGSYFYVMLGAGLMAGGIMLYRHRGAALSLFAAILLLTLLWSLWEVGLDWWPLSARGNFLFVMCGVLLLPSVHKSLGPNSERRRGVLALSLVMGIVAVVGVASWFTDQHQVSGSGPLAASSQSLAAKIPDGDWHAYGRTAFGQRFSPLSQITPQNVNHLRMAWTYRTGDVRQPDDPGETTFQVTPLKIGKRLFLCTPHQSVIALDADSGAEIWRFEPEIKGGLALQHLTCRGLSYHQRSNGSRPSARSPSAGGGPGDLPSISAQTPTKVDCPEKLFMPTADGRLIALDPDTGSVCKQFGDHGQVNLWANMPNVNPGAYYSTSPAAIARNLIIIGGAVLDNVSNTQPSGVIRAFDVETGELVWNWDSGRPTDTTPLNSDQTYTANSPNSWSIASVDETLGLIYVPLGNQSPDQWGGNRSDAVEKFSSSVTALDLTTGHVRWTFQTVHHDLWDYDVPAQPSLVDLTIEGHTVPALVQPTKQGDIFVLDRRSGEPILPVQEEGAPQGATNGDFTSETQPTSSLSYKPRPLTESDMWGATIFDQLICRILFRRLRYEGRFTPPSTRGSLVYPGNFGTFNWGGVAVDPVNQTVFATPTYIAFVSKLVPRTDDTSLLVQGKNPPKGNLPPLNENFGAPFAVQLDAFTSPIGLPCQAPPWGYVSQADLRSGQIIWMHKNGTVRDASSLPLPFRMGVPNLGGPIITAGGVAFLSGALDNYVRAYDTATGEELWRRRLPAGGQATPMTYAGADGTQFLLVVAGGHGVLATTPGDYVIAFALSKS